MPFDWNSATSMIARPIIDAIERSNTPAASGSSSASAIIAVMA